MTLLDRTRLSGVHGVAALATLAVVLGACPHRSPSVESGAGADALDAGLAYCAVASPGPPISAEHALCVARAHGFCSESVTCVAERRFDTWSVKSVLSDGCDPAAPAGGEALAIDAETGALLGRGTWTAAPSRRVPGADDATRRARAGRYALFFAEEMEEGEGGRGGVSERRPVADSCLVNLEVDTQRPGRAPPRPPLSP